MFLQVNGRKLYQPEDGVQLTVIDGHDGKVVESKDFRNSILQGIPAQIDNYVSGLRDGYEAAPLLLTLCQTCSCRSKLFSLFVSAKCEVYNELLCLTLSLVPSS